MRISNLQRATRAATILALGGALAAPALAGGYDATAETPPPAAPPMVLAAPMHSMTDWTGFYFGGSLGYGDVSGNVVLGDSVTGQTYGVQAGYMYDLGSVVLGAELQYVGTNITDDSIGLNVDSVARAKLRAGYDAGQFQPYAVIGAASLTTSGAVDDMDTGYLYGVGLDYRYGSNLILGAELLQHEFDDYAGSGIDVSATTIEARVSYRF
jgi:outer membrane immunogenic protein